MSDSTCRNMRKKDVKALVNSSKEDVEISKHPGATAGQIKSYLGWWYENYQPDTLVLCAGVNDLLYESWRCNCNKEDLCNEPEIISPLMGIGLEARRSRVTNINFCSLYTIKYLVEIKFSSSLQIQSYHH